MTGGVGGVVSDAFAWVRDRLYDCWPIRIVRDWEQGVRLVGGRVGPVLTSRNGLLGSGVHLFLPFLGELKVESVVIRAAESALQRLATRDGVDVSLAVTLTYRVQDLAVLLSKVHDHGDSVLDRLRGAAGVTVPTLTWDELPSKLQPELEAAFRRRVRGWGLDLVELVPTNLSRAPALHVLGLEHATGTL